MIGLCELLSLGMSKTPGMTVAICGLVWGQYTVAKTFPPHPGTTANSFFSGESLKINAMCSKTCS